MDNNERCLRIFKNEQYFIKILDDRNSHSTFNNHEYFQSKSSSILELAEFRLEQVIR